jgi:aldehyde:ferredoxin oxidoreductase
LSEKDTDGVPFTFGNAQALLWAAEALTYRRGFGDLLAEGVKRMSERLGGQAKEFAVHVKGQEVPMHEPRCKPGLGVGYTVSATGADHNHNIHDTLYQNPGVHLDRAKEFGVVEPVTQNELSDNKIRLLAYDATWRSAINTFLCCQFLPWVPSQTAEIFRAVTGWNTTVHELLKAGERAVVLPRVFNLREGFTAADDVLPKRFYTPHTKGARAGFQLDEAQIAASTRKYYGMMGWDEQGVPTPGKLAELNIAWAGEHLPK